MGLSGGDVDELEVRGPAQAGAGEREFLAAGLLDRQTTRALGLDLLLEAFEDLRAQVALGEAAGEELGSEVELVDLGDFPELDPLAADQAVGDHVEELVAGGRHVGSTALLGQGLHCLLVEGQLPGVAFHAEGHADQIADVVQSEALTDGIELPLWHSGAGAHVAVADGHAPVGRGAVDVLVSVQLHEGRDPLSIRAGGVGGERGSSGES